MWKDTGLKKKFPILLVRSARLLLKKELKGEGGIHLVTACTYVGVYV